LRGNFFAKSILARLKHHFWRIFWLEKMLLYLLSKLIKEDHFACKTTRMSELLASPELFAVHSKGPSHTSSRLSDYSFAKEHPFPAKRDWENDYRSYSPPVP